MIKKISYHKILFPINIFIILIFNLILINLPLSNTLGYEFSAINALLLVIISGLYTISFLKRNINDYKKLFKHLFYLFLLPLVISIIHSLLTMFCSFLDGLMFYLMITFPAIFVGGGLGIISLVLTKRFNKTFFIIIILFLALVPILEIYFFPQVYFYSPLIGFFPGNIYDEGLSPDLKLLLHQLLILLYFLLIIFSFFKWQKHIPNFRSKFLIIIVSVFALFEFISSYIGFTTPYSRLNNYLPKKIMTENTVLHYDDMNEHEAEFVALNQQYYFEKLSKELKIDLNRKIDVYLFNSRNQKKELFGAGNADVAKPWQYSVYVSKDSWNYTMQHEMVHVFSAEFGSGIFKLASGLNASMIEGMAESIDNNVDNYTVNDLAGLAYKNNYKIDISNLFTGLNFFTQSSTLSYTYSGAFFRFLIDKYGIEKVKEFYNDGNFQSCFNNDFNAVKQDFEKWLQDSYEIGNQNMADYYFGRLSIVQKVCPRFISDRLRKAWKYFLENEFEKSKSLFTEINNKVINYSALIGLSEIYLKQHKVNTAISLLNRNLNQLVHTPYYFDLQLRLADLYTHSDQSDSAIILYNSLIEENANYNLKRLAKVRIELLNDGELKNYLSGNDSVKFNILKGINEHNYFYNSIDLLLQLAEALNIDYKTLQKIFDKTYTIDDIESSYAVYKLSQYLLEQGNYSSSRKIAALSLRFKIGNPFYNSFKQNYDKVNWFYYNVDKKILDFKIENKDINDK